MQSKSLVLILSFVAVMNASAWAGFDSMSDHQAEIFRVQGNVRIMKSGTFVNAEKGMMLAAGDQIITGENSFIEISYDKNFLNIARIDANTKAEFRSIEPTDLHLEDGSVFSALDGLKANGGEYSVSTPTAVAAVRGTHFDVLYNADTKIMEAAVVPDTQNDHVSSIDLTPTLEDGTKGSPVIIEEGKEIELTLEMVGSGNLPEPGNIDPAKLEEAQAKLDQMMENVDPNLRKDGEQLLGAEAKKDNENSGEEKSDAKSKEDGDQKPAGGPNPPSDGNGPSGGPNRGPVDSSSGNLNRTDSSDKPESVDSLVDALIPGEDIPNQDGSNGNAGPQDKMDSSREKNDQGDVPGSQSESHQAPSPGSRPVDFGQMMQFLSTGGAFKGDDAGGSTDLSTSMSGIFGAMGYGPEMAGKMTEGMMNIMGNEHFDPTSFMGTGTAFANVPQLPMEKVLEHFSEGGPGGDKPDGSGPIFGSGEGFDGLVDKPDLPGGSLGDFGPGFDGGLGTIGDLNQIIQQTVNDFILTGQLTDATKEIQELTMGQRLDIYRYGGDLFDQMFDLISTLQDTHTFLYNAINNTSYLNTSPGLSVTTPISSDITLQLTKIQHEASGALVEYKIVQGASEVLKDSSVSPANPLNFPKGHCDSAGCDDTP